MILDQAASRRIVNVRFGSEADLRRPTARAALRLKADMLRVEINLC
jgi:hypothetical protein